MEPASNVSNLPVATATTPAAAFDFLPRSMGEAIEYAGALAKSTMVPKDYIDKPGNVLVAMQMGAELGLKPLQAMQSLAVINGKPGLYGDAGKALLLSKGCQIIERAPLDVAEKEEGECTIRRPGHPPVTRTFSVNDAKRARLWGKDGPWTLYPFRQLAWRAFWLAARDAAADILKGMAPAEELMDVPEKDVTAEGATLPAGSSEPAKQTRTGTLVDRLKAPSIGEVVMAFDDAKNADAIDAAVQLAKKLKSDDAKKTANEAYHRALARVRAAEKGVDTETGEVKDTRTDEQILGEIAAVKSTDELDVLADGLRGLDSTRLDLLTQHVQKRRNELRGEK